MAPLLLIAGLACRPEPVVYPPLEDTASSEGTGEGSGDDGNTGDDGSSGDDGSTGSDDTGQPERDWWEGWPQTTFFPTYCGACHPDEDGSAWDFSNYDHVAYEYDHIVCGVGLEDVEECYADSHEDPHEPTSLPRGSGPKPTAAERQRLVDWMRDGMPTAADL